MKILYVSNGYPPLHTAGAENYTAGLATAFARAGHAVRVICAGDWETGPLPLNGAVHSDHEGVAVTRLNLNWRRGPDPNRYLYDNPVVEDYVSQLLEQDRPDVVHVISCYTLSAGVLRAVQRCGVPVVVTLTDYWFLCPRVTLLRSDAHLCSGQTTPWECLQCLSSDAKAYRWLSAVLSPAAVRHVLTWLSRQPALSRRRGLRGLVMDVAARKALLPALLEQAAVLVAPSRTLADVFRANGIKRETRTIEHGHRLEWVKDLRPQRTDERLVFGFVGRIAREKGVHVLAAAAAQLSVDLPLRIEVWGDSSQEPSYVATLPEPTPGRAALRFRGRFDRSRLADVYSQIDVLVVPSIWRENNPLVIQEAFAAGIPVVASDLGGMAEFVRHGVNGLLVEAGDPVALAAAMTRLATEPALWQRLRKGTPPVRSIEQERVDFEALYREVLMGAARPSGRPDEQRF